MNMLSLWNVLVRLCLSVQADRISVLLCVLNGGCYGDRYPANTVNTVVGGVSWPQDNFKQQSD